VLNPSLDTHNYLNVYNPLGREKVLELTNDLQLLDYYRILYPNENKIYMAGKNPLKQARLDYILISESPLNMVEKLSIKPGYRSDHSALVIELKFDKFTRGLGLWTFYR
jgi:exonuclease III